MVHFNWTELIPGISEQNIHVATATVASLGLIIMAFAGRLALGKGEAAVIPADRFSLKGLFEGLIQFIASLSEMVVGKEGAKFVPIFATLFFFIFVNNLVGLLPGMTPATDNINTTVAIGVFSFLVYNFYGFREHGASYLKQFMGPMLLLAPLMIVIELISHFVRPMSLGLRLQGNMMGDHTVLGIFLEQFPYGIPVIFYFLGFFVCFMQAFVFTMLTMIYVSLAISHDH